MICLSFDTDRMSDPRMAEFLDLSPFPGSGTFFCTQLYSALADSRHELAPHAYLAPQSDWDAELASKRRDFPNAVGWRSHSCVFSHILAEQIAAMGYRYVSVHDDTGLIAPKPIRHAWGLWQLPIYYMDNLDFSAGRFWPDEPEPFDKQLIAPSLNDDGIYVWAFHPIHIALNSPSADEYFARRDAFEAGAPLAQVRYEGYGTADYFRELCEAMEEAGIASATMQSALALTVGHDAVLPATR
jgi:polysaccharide deactylase WbmS-like protein